MYQKSPVFQEGRHFFQASSGFEQQVPFIRNIERNAGLAPGVKLQGFFHLAGKGVHIYHIFPDTGLVQFVHYPVKHGTSLYTDQGFGFIQGVGI
ncbi:MAG: hypothetical protein BWX77_00154 [Bacteroidetes bacterium ADurb.Bin090]|nr:MAG: hypothetical protein BWX77_00154 [Bacteroidetes bacterium ADurb.Bin090]